MFYDPKTKMFTIPRVINPDTGEPYIKSATMAWFKCPTDLISMFPFSSLSTLELGFFFRLVSLQSRNPTRSELILNSDSTRIQLGVKSDSTQKILQRFQALGLLDKRRLEENIYSEDTKQNTELEKTGSNNKQNHSNDTTLPSMLSSVNEAIEPPQIALAPPLERIQPREELLDLIRTWQETLTRMGIKRDAKSDDSVILLLATRHGFPDTKFALIGAGHEPASNSYDPKKNVSIRRLLRADTFDRLRNIGAGIQPKQRKEGTPWNHQWIQNPSPLISENFGPKSEDT